MQTLRTDFRQWLIYDEPASGAVVRALEVMALGMAGHTLANHQIKAVRGIGNMMMRLADARTRAMLGAIKNQDTTEEANTAISHVIALGEWLRGGADPDREPVAVDELHATVFQLDHRLNSAGVSGPGWIRNLGRGD